MSTKRNYEAIERIEGLSATSLHNQVQEAQEAYYVLERDMESCMSIMQEATELFEDGDELGSIMNRMKQFLEEQQM